MKATPEPVNPKTELRQLALKRRDAIPQPVRRIKDAAIRQRLLELPEYQAATNILMFASFRSEVDTLGIIRAALAEKKTVTLPLTDPDTRTLSVYAITSIDELVEGFKGIPEPPVTDPRDAALSDIILMPGAAFDAQGGRIGYGMGCYDKLLAAFLSKPLLLALAYEEQLVPEVPLEGHDVRVDIIVTDKRIIRRGEG